VPRFDPTPPGAGPLVRGFAGSRFVVDDSPYDAVLLTPQSVAPWSPPPLAQLSIGDLQPLLDIDPRPEFLLFGSGKALARPPRLLADQLHELGIGIEPMDSRTAARTWAVLRAEERWIVAALMPLQAPTRQS
jgi:uncharacterized protein